MPGQHVRGASLFCGGQQHVPDGGGVSGGVRDRVRSYGAAGVPQGARLWAAGYVHAADARRPVRGGQRDSAAVRRAGRGGPAVLQQQRHADVGQPVLPDTRLGEWRRGATLAPERASAVAAYTAAAFPSASAPVTSAAAVHAAARQPAGSREQLHARAAPAAASGADCVLDIHDHQRPNTGGHRWRVQYSCHSLLRRRHSRGRRLVPVY